MEHSRIIKRAWEGFDPSKIIRRIEDISARVSTNHVFRITFRDGDIVIAKLSYFGKFEYFREDHRIIHALSNNLLYPFENVLAKSLLKNNRVYTYRYKTRKTDTWVVFYNPVRVQQRLPRRLEDHHIKKLAVQMARFHKACSRAKNVLPKSSKTLRTDIVALRDTLEHDPPAEFSAEQVKYIQEQCDRLLKNRLKLNAGGFESIPVFIDWNIGNFSVTPNLKLFSRWDYDWFRMSTRMMDFYFFSRVCSDVGDRTSFSYLIGPMMEDRFILFLKEYHRVYPLTVDEIRFMREAYRFFILNYVIKDGNYFFAGRYAEKLRKEALETYLPSVDRDFDPEKLIQALNLDK